MTAKTVAEIRPHPGAAAREAAAKGPTLAIPREITARPAVNDSASGDRLVARFLRALQVQLRSIALYQRNHPRVTESLEAAHQELRAVFMFFPSFGVRVEGGTLFLTSRLKMPASHTPGLPERDWSAGRALADPHGELRALGDQLNGAGVTSLLFSLQPNLGELAAFVTTVDATFRLGKQGKRGEESATRDWSAWAAMHNVTGIRVNASLERRHDAVLASLMAALLERKTAAESADAVAEPAKPSDASREQVRRTLQFLRQAGQRLDRVQDDSPQELAGAVQSELAAAEPQAMAMAMHCMIANPPLEGDAPGAYLGRIGDALAWEFAWAAYAARRVGASGIRMLFEQLYQAANWSNDRSEPEAAIEARVERFWAAMPAREIAAALATRDAWCVPVPVLRRHLEPLIAAAERKNAPTAGREARRAIENFARCLEAEEHRTRRTVATGLVELQDSIERLWPHPQLQALSPLVVEALKRESSPGIAGILVAVTENLARLALARSGYSEIESILLALDSASREPEFSHISALARRIVAQENWLTLVTESLTSRPLDPALPRLLRREPHRLLDRLGLVLTSPGGADSLPAMARLVRAAGEPVLGTLETQLAEPRQQRVATAIKLLSAVQPQRLASALPRVFSGWDWSLQDLAVTELSRQQSRSVRTHSAKIFLGLLAEAHLLVVPAMLDQIALAGEVSAVPQLWEIAAGDAEQLRDMFIRIKAVEALGRLRASDAADLLRNIVRERAGLTHAEPAGLRTAAEEALGLIENHPAAARARSLQEVARKSSTSFAVPRRYVRLILEAPVAATIAAPHAGTGRVRTLSLGGALVATSARLAVGDSMRIELRIGLRRASATAVVRHAGFAGYGVEFVHMKPEDREKLRLYISKLLR